MKKNNSKTTLKEGPLNQIKLSYKLFKGVWDKVKDRKKAEQQAEPTVQQTIDKFVEQEGEKDIPQATLDKIQKMAPPGQEEEYKVAAPALALALDILTGSVFGVDEKDALYIIKMVTGQKDFDFKDKDTKRLLKKVVTPAIIVAKLASGNVPGAIASAVGDEAASAAKALLPSKSAASTPKGDKSSTSWMQTSESKQPLKEGFFQDLLVKLRVVDSKKLVNSLFDIAEKKLKGLEKKARMREDGKTQVVDIGSAISYLGKKGVDLNLTEANKAVEAFAKATHDLNIKHKALMTVLSKGTDKYMPIEDVKKMLTLVMVMAQLADLINEVSKRIGYTVPSAKGKTGEGEKQPDEKKPATAPAKPAEVTKQAVAKAAETEVPEKVDPKVQKAVEAVAQKAKEKADERKEEPTAPPKQASKIKQDQYDRAKDVIDLAIVSVCDATGMSEEDAKNVIDSIIINSKIDLRNLDDKLFIRLTTAALDAIGAENITNKPLSAAIKQGLAQSVEDASKGEEGESKAEKKPAVGEARNYGEIDALLIEQMKQDGLLFDK